LQTNDNNRSAIPVYDFGFTLRLLGEGLNKIVHEEWNGLLSVIFGLMFIGVVIFTHLFFSSYIATHKAV